MTELVRSIALALVLVACSHPPAQRLEDPPPRRHSHIETGTLLPGIGGLCASDTECAVVTDCCGCSEGGHAIPIRVVEVSRHDEIKARECAHTACSGGPGRAQSCHAVPVCRQGRCRLLATSDDEFDEGDPGPK